MSNRYKTLFHRFGLILSGSVLLILITLWALSLRYQPGLWIDDGKGRQHIVINFWAGHCAICTDYQMPQVESVYFVLVPDGYDGPSGWKWPIIFHYRKVYPSNLLFPVWVLMLPTLIYSGVTLSAYRQRRKRIKHGLCLACGYDMQASGDTCPECGHQSDD